jgi:hypothetical protein
MKHRGAFKTLVALLFLILSESGAVPAQKHWQTPFGTTLPEDGALHCRIYALRDYTPKLPGFRRSTQSETSMHTRYR